MGYYAEKIRKQGFKEGKEKGYAFGISVGISTGYSNAQTTLITCILNSGYTPEEVSKMTNVNINEVIEIKEKLK